MLGSLWQRISTGSSEVEVAPPAAPEPDALAILEDEASVASEALGIFSATLRQMGDSAEAKPVQTMQFALPHQELQYLQLLEQRSEQLGTGPVMPGQVPHAFNLRKHSAISSGPAVSQSRSMGDRDVLPGGPNNHVLVSH